MQYWCSSVASSIPLKRHHLSIARGCSVLATASANSNEARMKLLPLILGSTVFCSTTTTTGGLPFRTRGQHKEDESDTAPSAAAEAVVDGGGNAGIVRIQHQNSKRNPVVETFYASPNDEDDNNSNDALYQEIKQQASNLTDFLVHTRRTLHRHPELMYQEEFTSRTVQALLAEMGVAFTTGWAKNVHPDAFPGPGGYGIVADIGTGGEPCVLLRADMDALPIYERTEFPPHDNDYRSQTDNKMHACGHDGHTTMLLGAASILHSMRDSLPGTVRIMFQPAEEGGAGGKRMREEGVLSKAPVPSYAFGMHVWPTLPTGAIAASPGPWMAACERFEILLHGVGGHAAMPHQTIDPIVTASAIVMNLQTIVSRTLSPLESGVCSITQFDAGSGAYNVIPDAATLKGTIRALSTETLLDLRDRVQHIVESTAKTHGCNVTIEYSPDYYPVTVNDPDLLESFGNQVAATVSEDGKTRQIEPTMGAEDFSFLAETIPSAFFFLGQGSGVNPPTNFGLHHPHFALDESVMNRGVELHVNLAVRALAKLAQEQKGSAASPK